MRFLRNNHGFSLVEILTSVVILGLVATVFFQFFVFSQKTTTGNQEKLVAINVAQGVLERIKFGGYKEITNAEKNGPVVYPKTYTESDCNNCSFLDNAEKDKCGGKYNIEVNNINYKIEVLVKQELDSETNLHSVEVIVKGKDDKTKSSVKGFVEL